MGGVGGAGMFRCVYGMCGVVSLFFRLSCLLPRCFYMRVHVVMGVCAVVVVHAVVGVRAVVRMLVVVGMRECVRFRSDVSMRVRVAGRAVFVMGAVVIVPVAVGVRAAVCVRVKCVVWWVWVLLRFVVCGGWVVCKENKWGCRRSRILRHTNGFLFARDSGCGFVGCFASWLYG